MNNIKKVGEKTILYEAAPHLLIIHFPNYNTLLYKLTGYLGEDEARDFFEKTLHFISQTNSSSLLADLSDFQGAPQNLAPYINHVFSQKLSDAGIKRLGMNRPQSGLGDFTNRLAAGSSARMFLQLKEYTQLEDALRWIEAESRQAPERK